MVRCLVGTDTLLLHTTLALLKHLTLSQPLPEHPQGPGAHCLIHIQVHFELLISHSSLLLSLNLHSLNACALVMSNQTEVNLLGEGDE